MICTSKLDVTQSISIKIAIRLTKFISPKYEYTITEIKEANLEVILTKSDVYEHIVENYHHPNEIGNAHTFLYLADKEKNLSLLKFIIHVVDVYRSLNYPISYDDLEVKIKDL